MTDFGRVEIVFVDDTTMSFDNAEAAPTGDHLIIYQMPRTKSRVVFPLSRIQSWYDLQPNEQPE